MWEMIMKIRRNCKSNNEKIGKVQKKSKLNSENNMEIMEEAQVEFRKYLEKYGIKTC